MSQTQYHVSYRWYYAVVLFLMSNLWDTINYAMFLTLNFSYLDLCVWRGRHLWFTLKPESCPGSPFLHSWSAPMAPEALHPVSSFLEKIWVSKYQLCCFLFQVKFGNHKFTPIFICFSPILGFLILSEANPLPVWPSLYFVSSYSSCSNTSSLSIFSLYLSTDMFGTFMTKKEKSFFPHIYYFSKMSLWNLFPQYMIHPFYQK